MKKVVTDFTQSLRDGSLPNISVGDSADYINSIASNELIEDESECIFSYGDIDIIFEFIEGVRRMNAVYIYPGRTDRKLVTGNGELNFSDVWLVPDMKLGVFLEELGSRQIGFSYNPRRDFLPYSKYVKIGSHADAAFKAKKGKWVLEKMMLYCRSFWGE
jgi:hypothetical protein